MVEHAAVIPTPSGCRFEILNFLRYFLYILRSIPSAKFYVGSSQDPARRLKFHNTLERGFTSRYRPWEIVFTVEFDSKEAATRAERKVKSWKSRQMIGRLIRREIVL